MVNPLLILPVLNATLSATTNCWNQNPHTEQQLAPLRYKQCREAINEISDDAAKEGRAPLTFGRDSHVGFEVPETWDYAGCHVTIDMVRPDVMEATTFENILHKAIGLNWQCVNKAPFLGGEVYVGENHLIKVSIHGGEGGVLRSM